MYNVNIGKGKLGARQLRLAVKDPNLFINTTTIQQIQQYKIVLFIFLLSLLRDVKIYLHLSRMKLV